MSLSKIAQNDSSIRITEKTASFNGSNTYVLDFNSDTLSLKDVKISLAHLTIPYSWRNVSSQYNNTQLSYIWGDSSVNDVTLSEGFYEVDDVLAYVQFVMDTNGHYLIDGALDRHYLIDFEVNFNAYKITFTSQGFPNPLPSGWTLPSGSSGLYTGTTWSGSQTSPQINFDNSQGGMATFFGTDVSTAIPAVAPLSTTADLESSNQENSPRVPKVAAVTTANIRCNAVFNDIQADSTVFSFTPDVGYGDFIRFTGGFMSTFHNCQNGSYPTFEISFYDQDNRVINIIDPEITCVFVFREK